MNSIQSKYSDKIFKEIRDLVYDYIDQYYVSSHDSSTSRGLNWCYVIDVDVGDSSSLLEVAKDIDDLCDEIDNEFKITPMIGLRSEGIIIELYVDIEYIEPYIEAEKMNLV